MTFGSLFSGIGGIDLGLERAGMTCKWQVEIDPFATKVLAAHWPNVKRYADIKTVGAADLEPVDLIAGGFPCQDLSQAGKRAGIEGSRSGLWFEFARIIGELRPRYVLAENVPGLLVYDGMRRVLGELSRRGYDAVWFSVRASDFGASHLRKRVFIVARRTSRPESGGENGPDGREIAGCESETLADSARGRWRELRESYGINGLTNGSHAELADTHERNGREFPRSDFGTVACADGESRGDLDNPARHEQSRLSWEGGRMWRRGIREAGEQLADASNGFIPMSRRGPEGRDGLGSAGALDQLADAAIPRLEIGRDQSRDGRETLGYPTIERTGAFAPGPADPRWPAILRERPDLAPSLESPLRGMANGIPDWLVRAMQDRTKRLSRLGNAVVPEIAEWIGTVLTSARSGTE